ncbi:hypothetical protein BN1723_016685 [Verticillium longisporum]|uniref:Uncharacterized protein n=1 Tax=Verticillium longisporum TaxID=100787 RepID=A0A0G4NJQ9_VERLO|nr:hypothetical protein BN1723_016685 [Verticillium longisporum]
MERASFDHSSLQRCPSARSSFDHGSSWRHRLPRGDEHRPSSRASSRQRPPSVSDYNASFLHSMHSAREYDRFDDERASMMSVSRHLRKSRSMLVPLPNHEPARAAKPTPSYYFTSRTPDQNKRQSFSTSKMQRDHSSRPSSTLSQSLRTPKSMSFLKTRNNKQQEKRQHHSDLAVQLAREKFREQVQKQEALKAQSSIGFHTTRQPSHTSSGFRKSLRNTSNASTGVSLAVSASHTLHPSKDASIRKTVRKVSNGLKTKLRNLFRRAKDEDDSASLQRSSPGLKQEQNPSTQSVSKPDDEDDYMNVVDPEPEKCSIARVMSRIPSLHAVPSSSKLRSRQGSMESIRSEQAHNSLDDKSRVTSWTNSAISIISNDKAHQRLSIIRETALPPTNTIYSESTYSHDKSPSVHFGGDVATEAPIYSPATFTSQIIPPFKAAKRCETGSNIHGAKATATITPSVSLNRIVSAASSVEWKTQLASHVSERESSTNEAKDGSKFGFKLTVPSMPNPFGHVRERADIVEGEPMSSSDSVHSSRTMTGPSNKGVLSDSKLATPNPPAPTLKLQPPIVPTRTSLRPLNSIPISATVASAGQFNPSTIRTVRSVNTLPDMHSKSITNKENAMPPGIARSASPVKLDTSGKIVDASCSLVRAEVDIFESLARKGWTGGGLEDLLERGRDLFASEAQDDGGIGGGGGGSSADPAKLFSILPPRSILADASGGDAARTTAAGGGGHGRSDSLLVDDPERYQSLIGAATVSPGGDEAETASVFSNSGFNRPRGARPFSPQPIRRDPTNVTYDDTLGVVGMADAGLGHLVVQRLEAAVEEEHDEEHEEHEEHDDEELRRDGAPARETQASEDMAESGGVQAAETLEDGVKDDDGERGRARRWSVVEDEDESYAANIRDKSKEIRRLEKEGLKLHRQRRRDVNGFRAHLVDLTTKLDGLTSLHGDHARTLLRESQDTSGKIVDASCSLVRAEVDIFESLARKGWTGGGLEDLLERGRDLFASEAQDDGGIGGGGGVSSADPAKLFSILPPRSILADASGGDAARTTAAGGGGHGRSDSLLVDDPERYQSLIGAATVSPGGDEAETASVFSNSGFNRPRGARPFSPQPIRRDPTNVTYDDTLGVVGMADAGLGHLVVQRLEAAVEEEHDEEHEEHEEHAEEPDDEELRRDGAPTRETHASEDMAESGGVQAADETLEDGAKDDDGERGRARRWSVNSDERSE